MSAALLLRLFQSDYFNVHLAVSYLRTYPDSVGISYYLVHRLAQVSENDLEFYWPQICHLVVTQNSESGALEGFVVKMCEDSIHLAMLTLWQMQASLADLSVDPKTTPFATCRRIYNRVQTIVFSDALIESSIDVCHRRRKLNGEHVKSALAGMGIAMSAIALPKLAAFEGQVAVEEGKKAHTSDVKLPNSKESRPSDSSSDQEMQPNSKRDTKTSSNHNGNDNGIEASQNRKARRTVRLENSNAASDSSSSSPRSNESAKNKESKLITPPSFVPGTPLPLSDGTHSKHAYPSLTAFPDPLRKGQGKSLQYRVYHNIDRSASPSIAPIPNTPHSMSMDNLSLQNSRGNIMKVGTSRKASSPVKDRKAQFDRNTSTPDTSDLRRPWQGRSSWGSGRHAASTPSLNTQSQSTDNLLHHKSLVYDLPPRVLSLLLRSYACRSQLEFLTSLQDIATHLVNVPKAARLSALRAELTLLNHGLPRGCCLCLGCSGQGCGSLVSIDTPEHIQSTSKKISYPSIFARGNAHRPVPHHRIVRICPSEAVVLNSADRAPYLIVVEVLERDLDFDPARRQNAEDIRNVIDEREGRRQTRTPIPNNPYTSFTANRRDARQRQEASAEPSTPRVDYEALRDTELSSTNSESRSQKNDLPAPKVSQGEEVDLVEQLYGGMSVHDYAAMPSPQYHQEIRNRIVDERAWATIKRGGQTAPDLTHGQLNHASSQADTDTGPTAYSDANLTLDQYAERMRVAAVMLTQLTASQQLPLTRTEAVTGVVEAGVGLGVNLTYGVGTAVGSIVGVGVEAVRSTLVGSPHAPIGATAPEVREVRPAIPAVDADSVARPRSPRRDLSEPPLAIHTTLSVDHLLPSDDSGGILYLQRRYAPKFPARQRVLSVEEVASIRNRIMDEMLALEEERMARMKITNHSHRGATMFANAPAETTEEESVVLRALNKDDPSGSVLSESWDEKKSRVRKGSPYGHLLDWNMISVIVKTGADLRQEQLAVQLIAEFGRIWKVAQLPHWVRYFRILVTSESTGLMETITDAVSVHSLKKAAYSRITRHQAAVSGLLPSYTLYDHFIDTFGDTESSRFRRAQDEFMKSLASYSIITYLLQVKDRHNGNILIDKDGHIMHIDFGFMLSNSPGSLGFEKAPFKLTQDYIDILGGVDSSKFEEFRALLKRLFREARQHAEKIIIMVELMQANSRLPCFTAGLLSAQHLRDRFQLGLPTSAIDTYVDRLVISSAGSAYTRLYDTFQRHSQGVL